MKLVVLAVSLVLFASWADARVVNPGIEIGWRLERARAAVIRNGWKPIHIRHKEGGWTHYEYPEIEACSMGAAYCLLYYKKGGRCLLIETKGEFTRRVVAWEYTCPDPD